MKKLVFILILACSCGEEEVLPLIPEPVCNDLGESKGCSEFSVENYVNNEASKTETGCFYYRDDCMEDYLFLGRVSEWEMRRVIDSLRCEKYDFSTLWSQKYYCNE